MDFRALRRDLAQIESSVDDKTLFTSKEFLSYADTMIHSVSNVPKGHLSLSIEFSPESDLTAFTDTHRIVANLGNRLIQRYNTETGRFLAAMGMLFHECAHVRFYDHQNYMKRMKQIANGKFPVKTPAAKGNEEELAGITAFLRHPVGRKVLSQIVSNIDNCVVDYHDERCMIQEDGSYVRYGIHTIGESIRACSSSIETMLKKDNDDLSIILSLTLQYARWKKFIAEDDTILDTEPHVQIVKAMAPYLDKAMSTDDVDVRFVQYNQCLLKFWPVLKNMLDKLDQTQKSQNTSGNAGQSESGQAGDSENSGEGNGSSDGNNDPASDGSKSSVGNNSENSGNANESSDGSNNATNESCNNSGDGHDEKASNSNDDQNGTEDQKANTGEPSGDESRSEETDPENDTGAGKEGKGDDTTDQNDARTDNSGNGQSCEQLSKADLNTLVSRIEKSIAKAGDTVFEQISKSVDNGCSQVGQTTRPNMDSAPSSGKKASGKKSSSSDIADAFTSPAQTNDALQAAEAARQSITHSIAEQVASSNMETKIFQSELIQIKDIPMSSTHKGQKIDVIDVPVTAELKNEYEHEMTRLKNLSLSLQRKVRDAIKIRQQNETKHHRVYGRKIAVRDVYRRDNRFFDQKKMPGDPTDIAIAIIIDRSASMGSGSGDDCRMIAAVRAATLVYDFASALHIPIMVAGHNYIGDNRSALYLSATFDSRPDDKYRIMDQRVAGSNRDGLIINTVAELLSRRSEEVKLLFVISDGQPNAGSYRGEPARKDIQQIIKKYKGKGVTTFATAIGSDREKIKEIYGDGYIDISDLKTFPQRLVRMIAKRIV